MSRSSRRPTLADVAREAGVSVMTVSNVVNKRDDLVRQQTQRRVLDAVGKLGYRPQIHARSLRLSRSWCIGLLIATQGADSLATPWTSRMVAGLSNVLSQSGFGLLLDIRSMESIDESVLLKLSNTDGIVAIISGDDELRRLTWAKLGALKQPIVALQETLDIGTDRDFSLVRQNEFESAFLLAEHVLRQGASDLRFLEPKYFRPNFAQRSKGIAAAVSQTVGASVRVVQCSDETFRSVEEAVGNDIKLNGPPDAYLASNESMALATLSTLEAAGYSVPADIKLTGFNAFDLWFFAKRKITTISFPAIEIGARAGKLMIDRLVGKSFSEKLTVFSGEFLQGDTTQVEDP